MHVSAGDLALRAQVAGFRVYSDQERGAARLRVVDWAGLIRLQRRAALAVQTTAARLKEDLAALWQEVAGSSGQAGVVLMHGRHLADLTGLDDLEQAGAVAMSEVKNIAPGEPVIILAAVENVTPR